MAVKPAVVAVRPAVVLVDADPPALTVFGLGVWNGNDV
jgi:hypothetical protein